MRRRTALLAALVVAGLAAPHAAAAVRYDVIRPVVPTPVVALVDTGVRATHQEFDYRGPSSSSDQFVGWWDFTSEVKKKIVLPKAGQSWDTTVRDPYDRHGHGTGTAGMAVGRNVVTKKTPSAYPGGRLAVAKVGTKDGAIEGDLAAAIRWATDTIHADVISMSIGTIVPIPTALSQATYDAITAARRKGVLVVVANGNGWGNVGVLPGEPGWATAFGSSPDVLSVGAADASGYLVTTDPEVAAAFNVIAPSAKDDNVYVEEAGTSFSAPFVAGFAASVLKEAWNANRSLDRDRLEQLIKYSAQDTVTPPQFEGYGVLSLGQLPAAKSHARAGTLPGRPSPDVSGTYVEQVAGQLRSIWSG